jgi:hypothetical protein
MVKNSININKTKENFNSDGLQFYQYHQTTAKTFFWFVDIGGIVDITV